MALLAVDHHKIIFRFEVVDGFDRDDLNLGSGFDDNPGKQTAFFVMRLAQVSSSSLLPVPD